MTERQRTGRATKNYLNRLAARSYGHFDNIRGAVAETRVELAVRTGIESGELPTWISGYYRSSREEDSQGVDGWISTDVGLIPLQIKSSARRAHEAKRRHPDVPIVIVRMDDSTDRILKVVSDAISQPRREIIKSRGLED